MPLSNSVIRRYTPPTCTLEVLAQSSPLSRWMGKSVLKQVRFNLHFDDPRQPEKEKVVVKGDRDQLEALSTAVSGYVQEILQQSPENFWASRVEAHSADRISEARAVEDFPQLERRNEFAHPLDIYLQPSSHLTHKLFLGSLASPVSGASIQLSLLQLFDLATALDEYTADVVALPTETQPHTNSFALPAWAPVAAVLVLGLGLMPLTYQYANRVRDKNTDGKVATIGNEIDNNVSSTPNSLTTPLPELSPLPNSSSSLTVPNPSSPLQASPKPGSTFPSASTNPNSNLSSIPLPPLGSDNFSSSTALKPQVGRSSAVSITPTPEAKTAAGQVSIKPKLGENSATPKTGTSLPSTTMPSASLPSLTNPSTPKLPELPPSKQAAFPQSDGNQANSPKISSDLEALLTKKPPATPTNNSDKSALTTAAANSESFDTTQVAEVKTYLKKRWQPPSGLKQSLQYSLTVGVDGALEQILPLGKAARDYVDKAGIPKIGEPFVSPSRNGQNVKLRAVLKPNGEVQAIPETD